MISVLGVTYYIDNETESIFFDLENSTAYDAEIKDIVKTAGTNIVRCYTTYGAGHTDLNINFYAANSDYITGTTLNIPNASKWALNCNSTHVFVIYHDFDDSNFKIAKYAIDGTAAGTHTIGTTTKPIIG